jgi:tetratricopeptide (TPR) repeat protein
VIGGDLAFFQDGLDAIEHNLDCAGAHGLHGLAHGGERRSVESRRRHIVEANDRAMLGNAQASLVQRADCAEGGHVVEGEQSGEWALLPEQVFGELLAHLEAGKRVAGVRQFDDQFGVQGQIACLGAIANAAPAWRAIGEIFGPANEGNLAMAGRVQVFERQVAANFVIDDDGTHGVALEFATDQRGGNAAFFEIGEEIDIEKQPVGENHQAFDAAVEEHFEIAFEAAAIIVDIGENRQIRGLIERVFDAAQHQRAVGVGHIENHDADGMAALAAQGAGELVGAISQLFGGALDALLGDRWDIARQRRVIENDGNGGGGETAFLRYVANSDHLHMPLLCRKAERCARRLNSWRRLATLQQRVIRVSSFSLRSLVVMGLLLMGCAWVNCAAKALIMAGENAQSAAAAQPSGGSADPAQVFQQGQEALNQGRLDEAERDFRQVIAANPQVGGAYANLGVVYMRRKQWAKALATFRKAEALMPQVAGVRLNIGLAYYRQNEFLKAIPQFESVVRDEPNALQPRHLLGLCYFFVERWKDAATTLQPLWDQESDQLSYLYVLSIAAHRAGIKELDEQATAQLIKAGEGSPEFHLFMGKAHLNLEQYDLALADFQAADKANPKLTFVHFNLGLAYLKKQEYEKARDEFLADSAIEPELAYNYDKLGDVYSLMQSDAEAEKSYREAVRRDPTLLNSYQGLAKTYLRTGKYQQGIEAIDAALKLDPKRTDSHYVKGQLLLRMGRKEAGKKELETAVRLDNERRAERQKQTETGTVPSPELLQDEP